MHAAKQMASGMKNSDVAENGGRHRGRVFDSAVGFPIWREFLWGALAGAFGESIMHPVDTTKTRMQSAAFVGGIQTPKSIRQMVKTVWVTDGFRGFYRGVTPGITGSLATGATYFGVIESTKKWLEKNPSLEGHWAHFIAGAVGDTFGSFIYVPCEVMKQRMQVQGTKKSWNSMISKDNASSLKSGTNMYEYYTGIFQAGTSIWKREGLRGLYEGYWSTLMRDVPFAGLMVMFYEAMKDTVEYGKRRWALGSRWQDQNSFEGLVLGGVAGGVSAYMTTPLDVIKTRLQVQGSTKRYNGWLDAFQKIWSTEGTKGFFRGSTARVIWYVPASACTFMAVEFLREHFNDKIQHDAHEAASISMETTLQ